MEARHELLDKITKTETKEDSEKKEEEKVIMNEAERIAKEIKEKSEKLAKELAAKSIEEAKTLVPAILKGLKNHINNI